MKTLEPTYKITLASMPSDVDADSRMAQFLKSAGRRYKFRCVSVIKVEPLNADDKSVPIRRRSRTVLKKDRQTES